MPMLSAPPSSKVKGVPQRLQNPRFTAADEANVLIVPRVIVSADKGALANGMK